MSFGSNTTGAPKTGDYFLGRGKVYISLLDTTTNLATKWRAVGNATAMKLTVKNTKVQHYNSQSALKRADDEVATQQDITMMMTLDEISAENLALFTSGTVVALTNPAIAGFTNAALVLNADAVTNTWYDIQTTTGVRAFDLTPAVDPVLSVIAPGTPAALVETTDYVLDRALGRFFLLASGVTKVNTGGAGIIKIILPAMAAASPVTQTRGEASSPARVAIKLLPLNAKSPNDRAEVQIHSVMLTANGDLSLIEDKYTDMSFDGLCGANVQIDANSPYFTISSLTTPRS